MKAFFRLPGWQRNLIAVMAALVTSAMINWVLARLGLVIATNSAEPMAVAAGIAVFLSFLVPVVAGAVLGLLADRPAVLTIPVILLSLAGTAAFVGIEALPRRWKIVEYLIQGGIIAGVATLVAARRRNANRPTAANQPTDVR